MRLSSNRGNIAQYVKKSGTCLMIIVLLILAGIFYLSESTQTGRAGSVEMLRGRDEKNTQGGLPWGVPDL